MFQQVTIQCLSHSFGNKSETICFDGFNTSIYSGDKIALIGQNGSGKSTLLKILNKEIKPNAGDIIGLENVNQRYVPQTFDGFNKLSGAECFQKSLSQAIAKQPDILLLDEPSNHLDNKNRQSLMRMLKKFNGILIIATHDRALIESSMDIIWHIENGKINVYKGRYSEYLATRKNECQKLYYELSKLKRDKIQAHETLMREQQHFKKSKTYGRKRYAGDKLTLSGKKRQGATTTTKKQKVISQSKKIVLNKISDINIPELIKPKFAIEYKSRSKENVIQVSDGFCGYDKFNILENISFNLNSTEKIALKGENASGKSTFIKALLDEQTIRKSGFWHVCHKNKIGYLDQNYQNINLSLSVLDNILCTQPSWTKKDAHKHLNDFLFKKYDDIHKISGFLSGGERCRLSLAMIAAKVPALLILDEVTNNLDMEIKEHVVQVLKYYPGAMIVVSHETHFLEKLDLHKTYIIRGKKLDCE